MISNCEVCLAMKNTPAPAPLFPWRLSTSPWERIHIDFASLDKKDYLIVIDTYSKWLEVEIMPSITSMRTIKSLRHMFAREGLPKELVSDNGPQLTSDEFTGFLKNNGIKHSLVPPYHPSSNGAAERSVQIAKNALKKHMLSGDGVSVQERLDNFLLMYRTTPHSSTGRAPAELFRGRQLRTRLSLLKPDLQAKMQASQDVQRAYHDGKAQQKLREFDNNEKVMVKSTFKAGIQKFVPGQIVQRKGPLTYLVRVDARVRFCHVDHLLKCGQNVKEQLPVGMQNHNVTPSAGSDHAQIMPTHTGEKPYNVYIQPSAPPLASVKVPNQTIHTGEKLYSSIVAGTKPTLPASPAKTASTPQKAPPEPVAKSPALIRRSGRESKAPNRLISEM